MAGFEPVEHLFRICLFNEQETHYNLSPYAWRSFGICPIKQNFYNLYFLANTDAAVRPSAPYRQYSHS